MKRDYSCIPRLSGGGGVHISLPSLMCSRLFVKGSENLTKRRWREDKKKLCFETCQKWLYYKYLRSLKMI